MLTIIDMLESEEELKKTVEKGYNLLVEGPTKESVDFRRGMESLFRSMAPYLDAFDERLERLQEENEKLKKENNIYKIRHKEALKKLNSAMKHYGLEDKNNTIKFCKEILEGEGIEERVFKILEESDNRYREFLSENIDRRLKGDGNNECESNSHTKK